MMGGSLELDSKENEGSKFSFTLSLATGHDESLAPMPADADDSEDIESVIKGLQGIKVLLVDDNELNLEMATGLLELEGLVVETATNGQEALDRLNTGHYDCVLMDYQMPVMDGLEATRRIREQEGFRDLPIIAMTANAMKGAAADVMASGMNDYIPKPVDPDAMFATIAKWVNPDHQHLSN